MSSAAPSSAARLAETVIGAGMGRSGGVLTKKNHTCDQCDVGKGLSPGPVLANLYMRLEKVRLDLRAHDCHATNP